MLMYTPSSILCTVAVIVRSRLVSESFVRLEVGLELCE